MKISKEIKEKVHKRITSLEFQIEAMSKDIDSKWKLRKEMTERLAEAWHEIDETRPNTVGKEAKE